LLWLSIIELAFGHLRNLGSVEAQIALLVGAAIVVALFNVILSVILAPLLAKIGPELVSKRWGRFLLAVLCGLVMLCGWLLPAFAGAAVLFILMARQAVKEWRYQADWA
jgi:uncharacterized membrane protein